MQKQNLQWEKNIKKKTRSKEEDDLAINNQPTIFGAVVLRRLRQSENFTITTHLLIYWNFLFGIKRNSKTRVKNEVGILEKKKRDYKIGVDLPNI